MINLDSSVSVGPTANAARVPPRQGLTPAAPRVRPLPQVVPQPVLLSGDRTQAHLSLVRRNRHSRRRHLGVWLHPPEPWLLRCPHSSSLASCSLFTSGVGPYLQDTGLVSPGNRSGSIGSLCDDPRLTPAYDDPVPVGLPHRIVHGIISYRVKIQVPRSGVTVGHPVDVSYAATAFSARLIRHLESLGAAFDDDERKSFIAV